MTARRLLFLMIALPLLACQRVAPPASPATGAPTTPAGAPAAPRVAPATQAHWQCGELRLATRFDDPSLDTLTVLVSGRRLSLASAAEAQGARFADAAGNAFSSRPGQVRFTPAGAAALDCRKTRAPSPWVDALARGVAWRAAGNEPGWFAEVAGSPDAALHATLDYGDRRIDLARTQRLSDGRFEGRTGAGESVRLEFERTPCRDGMSGEAFEARATLAVGEQVYRGCGAFLGD